MAKFELNLPESVIKDFKRMYDNAEEIFAYMTQEGAKVAKAQCDATAPPMVRAYSRLSRTYKTPSDDGIATQVYYLGYIPFSNPNRKYFTRKGGGSKVHSTTEGVPVEFLCNLYEYGRSTSPFPKKPWFRKAFRGAEIARVMYEAQKKASGGLLE